MILDSITWTASPNLFSFGSITVRWYGLMFAIGFLVGYEIVYRIFRHEGARESWVGSLFIYVVVATIVGARLGHVFFYDWDYYSQHLGDIPKIWEGGLASHGGTLGIMLAIWLYSRLVTRKPILWTLDRLVVPVGFVAALIRIGNLMNHEIYGGETSLPWGFIFDLRNETEPKHPTQLYEALSYLVLGLVMVWIYWKKLDKVHRGFFFGLFLVGCFGMRFLIEFIKEPQVGFEEGMALNMGQLLSIPFVIAGIALLIYSFMHKTPARAVHPEETPRKQAPTHYAKSLRG